jgi:FdhD protein
MGRRTARTSVRRVDGRGPRDREERLAVEEPLEIRVAGQVVSTTMRTPGDDLDLTRTVTRPTTSSRPSCGCPHPRHA